MARNRWQLEEYTVYAVYTVYSYFEIRIPTVKLKIPGKSIFELRNQKFCYIQVIVFDLRVD